MKLSATTRIRGGGSEVDPRSSAAGEGGGRGDFRRGPAWSDDHGWQSNNGIIAQGRHGFQGHAAGALDGPFIVLLEQERADGVSVHCRQL